MYIVRRFFIIFFKGKEKVPPLTWSSHVTHGMSDSQRINADLPLRTEEDTGISGEEASINYVCTDMKPDWWFHVTSALIRQCDWSLGKGHFHFIRLNYSFITSTRRFCFHWHLFVCQQDTGILFLLLWRFKFWHLLTFLPFSLKLWQQCAAKMKPIQQNHTVCTCIYGYRSRRRCHQHGCTINLILIWSIC